MNSVIDTYIDVLTESVEVKASTGVQANRLIDFQGQLASAYEKPLGVARFAGNQGQHIPVGIIGIFPVEAAGTITIGARIASAAQGKAQAVSVTSVNQLASTCGYALSEGSAGDIVRVMLVP